jgi:NAD(P)-dependent dehydrogenase (short-subunit alcohol dehydrogenase family)
MQGSDRGIAFITGAAGSMGRATVRAFSSRGLAVSTADHRRLPDAESKLLAEELTFDLHDEAAVRDAMTRIRSLGPLQHVIAIAGGGDPDELAQSDPATEELQIFARVVSNNLHIAFGTIRHVVPLLRDGEGNRSITLVGSINAYGGYGAPGYSAAKSGLIGLTKALTQPLGADGIRINCLTLGTVDTENVHDLAAARGVDPDLPALSAKAPLGRVLTPEEVGGALAAIALDMPGLTGATIVLDNGQTLIR